MVGGAVGLIGIGGGRGRVLLADWIWNLELGEEVVMSGD